MNFAVKLIRSGVDPSDLSTPRDALIHYRDLLCAAVEKNKADRFAKEFDDLFKKLDSGKFSPDQVQLLHLAAKETCLFVRVSLALLGAFPEDDVAKGAGHIQNAMVLCFHVIRKAAVGENVKEFTEFYQNFNTEFHLKKALEENNS
jgi:hypothetical protein